MGLDCVLWDFGDTLADQRWMLRAPHDVPEWPDVWSRVTDGALGERWNLGHASLADVVEAVSACLPMTTEAVSDHVRRCCSRLRFFDAPLWIARHSAVPQALVTVNPDGFSELVVPTYRLDRVFEPIVTSWQERTLDKSTLGRIALERLGRRIAPSRALLIDDRIENVEAWKKGGGRGYLFRGEPRFREDLRSELRDLAASAGWRAAAGPDPA